VNPIEGKKSPAGTQGAANARHNRWVKSSHWMVTVSFLILAFTGFVILMSHPRLYWGNAGNDLTPALFELPISRNFQHGGWEKSMPFFAGKDSPVSAARTYDIFNQNGWGRSLHFLSAWLLGLTGIAYLLIGLFSGHFRKAILPGKGEYSLRNMGADLTAHFRRLIPSATGQDSYGLLQKWTYSAVIFFLFPTVILTGFTMSPAITAAFPFLLKIFFGAQSARTLHFFASIALELFLVIHIVMVARTGFKQQMRSMTWG
jgi:thiosulfate reductase cytochrome b subunit